MHFPAGRTGWQTGFPWPKKTFASIVTQSVSSSQPFSWQPVSTSFKSTTQLSFRSSLCYVSKETEGRPRFQFSYERLWVPSLSPWPHPLPLHTTSSELAILSHSSHRNRTAYSFTLLRLHVARGSWMYLISSSSITFLICACLRSPPPHASYNIVCCRYMAGAETGHVSAARGAWSKCPRTLENRRTLDRSCGLP